MKKKNLSIIATTLICALLLSSCGAIFPTQKMIDSILKNNNEHAYSISDLIPFNENELKNARSLYGMELNDYYNNNVNAGLEGEELKLFQKNLIYMDYNYSMLLERYNMYTKDENSYNMCKEEFDAYYKLKDSKAKKLIKDTNKGNLSGAPNISVLIDMNTLKDYDIYSEAEAEIFDQVVISDNDYKKLKIGDTISLIIPATNSTIGAKETIKKTFTYIATNSISYKETDENGLEVDTTYFITQVEPLNNTRKLVDINGNVIEIYRGREVIQFMKYAFVAKSSIPERLYQNIISKRTTNTYYMNDFAIKAQTGGYLVEEYKDTLYANSIYTNLKGYITQCLYFDNFNMDNEYTSEYRNIKNAEKSAEFELIEKRKQEQIEKENAEREKQIREQENRMNNMVKIFEYMSIATSSEMVKEKLKEYNLKEEEVFGSEGYIDQVFSYQISTNSKIDE